MQAVVEGECQRLAQVKQDGLGPVVFPATHGRADALRVVPLPTAQRLASEGRSSFAQHGKDALPPEARGFSSVHQK